MRFGPEVLGYAVERPGHAERPRLGPDVPRSLVVDPAFDWRGDVPPGAAYADTVIYEVHVKGFTMQPSRTCPTELRGTYAGLGARGRHRAPVGLGVTAVELLPVHQYVPEAFLVDRGLTNYWGYNTIGFFAPTPAYSAAVRAGQPGGQVAEFKAMVDAAARRRARGHPRRGVQPHRRGQPLGPDAVPPRPRQPGLLPAGRRRSAALLRHDRLRQLAERRRPAHPAADHGLAALLADRDARRRLPLRPRRRPWPARTAASTARPRSSTWSPRTRSCPTPS